MTKKIDRAASRLNGWKDIPRCGECQHIDTRIETSGSIFRSAKIIKVCRLGSPDILYGHTTFNTPIEEMRAGACGFEAVLFEKRQ